MLKRKNNTIQPNVANEDILVQITEPQKISKKNKITVPTQYKAIAYIDQKPLFRIDVCLEKPIVKTYGKEYIGKELKVAFITAKSLSQSAWGFGNIQVNNERLKEAYRVGANGKFTIDIVDYSKLIQAFPNAKEITMDQVREKTISTIKTVGTPILSEYFSNTTTSVFEINSLMANFRERFVVALQEEKLFIDMGIKISSMTVDGFHVNEEDIEMIRKRINEGEA